jgi:hypothetical protein
VDPVTGLSRRQLLALALLVPVGIAASTIATVISERRQACPDERNGCSTSVAGEPIVIGVMAQGPSFREAVAAATSDRPEILGHRLHADLVNPGCSVRTSAEEARDVSDDPADFAPAAVVVTALCPAATGVAAQVLDDEGVPMVSLGEPDSATPTSEQDLVTGVPIPPPGELVERIAGALEDVAIEEGDRVVIPLTELREALVARGFLET